MCVCAFVVTTINNKTARYKHKKYYFLVQIVQTGSEAHLSSYLMGPIVLSQGQSGLGVKLTNDLHLVPRLKVSLYLLTPWSRVLLEKLTGSAASQEIPRIFGTRRFITVLTSARQLSLS